MTAHDGFAHESTKNITQEWYTPPFVFEKLGLEFDLDPCSPMNGGGVRTRQGEIHH